MFLFTDRVWLISSCTGDRAFPCWFDRAVRPLLRDQTGWMWRIQRAAAAAACSTKPHQWPAYCSQSISLYVIIVRFTCIFPLIQSVWKTIMQLRCCLLFNYRTYLSNMQCSPALQAPPPRRRSFCGDHCDENWINVTEEEAPYEA